MAKLSPYWSNCIFCLLYSTAFLSVNDLISKFLKLLAYQKVMIRLSVVSNLNKTSENLDLLKWSFRYACVQNFIVSTLSSPLNFRDRRLTMATEVVKCIVSIVVSCELTLTISSTKIYCL